MRNIKSIRPEHATLAPLDWASCSTCRHMQGPGVRTDHAKQSHATHWHAWDPRLETGLVGKLGELPCLGTGPTGELESQNWKQARPSWATHRHMCEPDLEVGQIGSVHSTH